MRIGVIGAGNIGRTLGQKWVAQGHDVVFGVRDPQAKIEAGLWADTIEKAVKSAEVILFAIPGKAMADTIAQLGKLLDEKILIDATNNVGGTPMHQLSLLRSVAPNASLYRAFSNLGWENFADPIIDGTQADLFFCGDGDKQIVIEGLIADIGLHPVYVGDNQFADVIDAMTRLWFALVFQQGLGRHLALKLLSD